MHEARGEPLLGQAGVAKVLQNRHIGSGGKSITELTDPTQFTDFQFGGREYTPQEWGNARQAIQMDPGIGNATHYYNPSDANPYWGEYMTDDQTIGGHRFGNLGTPDKDPFLRRLLAQQQTPDIPMPQVAQASMMGGPGAAVEGLFGLPGTPQAPGGLGINAQAGGLLGAPGVNAYTSMPVGGHPAMMQAEAPDPFQGPVAAPIQDNPAMAGLPPLPEVEMPMPEHTKFASAQPSLLAPPQGAPAAGGAGPLGFLGNANRGLLGGTGFDFMGAILRGFGGL